jgi:hypothetical protein
MYWKSLLIKFAGPKHLLWSGLSTTPTTCPFKDDNDRMPYRNNFLENYLFDFETYSSIGYMSNNLKTVSFNLAYLETNKHFTKTIYQHFWKTIRACLTGVRQRLRAIPKSPIRHPIFGPRTIINTNRGPLPHKVYFHLVVRSRGDNY